MNIETAISRVDSLKPNNGYSEDIKIAWLSQFDLRVKDEIIDKSINEIEFNGYEAETNKTTELLIPAPYDEIYVYYLMAQIDYINDEVPKYVNNMNLVNTLYDKYAKKYRQEHKPRGAKKFKYYGG